MLQVLMARGWAPNKGSRQLSTFRLAALARRSETLEETLYLNTGRFRSRRGANPL